MREIVIAGAGLGSFTPEVMKAVNEADIVFADSRFREMIPPGKKITDIRKFAEIDGESGKILVLVSGDPGIFSLLPVIKKRYPNENITVLPGISALQAICAHSGETWQNAAILSGHGRSLSPGKFLNTVERNRITILFCDKNISPSWACKNSACIPGVDVVIGSCLGGNDERIFSGTPDRFAGCDFPELSIILIRNNNPYTPERLFLRDRDFLREPGIVMTNESVRSVIISRLELDNDSVLWDIGAGSGSISISAGNIFPSAEIHAVDFSPESARLISRNAEKFHLHNITVHNSRALDVVDALPAPSHIFIGGSGGELAGLFAHISAMNHPVRVVAACVTLETFTEAYTFMKGCDNFEAVQVSSSSSKTLAPSLTMMKAANPVTILSANNEQKFTQ